MDARRIRPGRRRVLTVRRALANHAVGAGRGCAA
ncbi:hypothetical protein ACFQ9Z_38995 [Streptomyces sp. NPDC056580]